MSYEKLRFSELLEGWNRGLGIESPLDKSVVLANYFSTPPSILAEYCNNSEKKAFSLALHS